jgi:predicted AlkP superfamily pyrophosphatase or phosphodiesterase
MQLHIWMYVFVAICLLNANFIHSHGMDDDNTAKTKHLNDKKNNTSKDNVLLISFDSFGWKYLDLVETPVLDTFKKQGVYADYMINVIPTETFPNHVSLATGLYPESHGIVSNDMYDPIFHDYFNMSVTDPKWWWGNGVQPIWYTNEKQGGISGVTYWPGYNIQNYTSTYWNKLHLNLLDFENMISYKDSVDLAMKWLRSEKPPNFLMLYFGMLDHAGHQYGFGSPQALQEVKNIDNITGYLLEQLEQNNLLDKWNIILTADHGMTNISESRVINITDYVNTSECTINGDGGVRFVWPNIKGTEDIIYKKLKEKDHPHMQVWLKENFPEKYHYRNNRRIAPILVTDDEGWTLVNDPKIFKWTHKGTHGYLNTFPSMWPIFFARGPAFKKGYHSKTFNSVDLYPLMCKLLKIKANPNNGSYSAVEPLLLGSNENSSFSGILVGVMVSSIFFGLGILICSVTICLSDRKVKRFRTNRAWNNNMVMSQLEQSDKLLLNEDGDDDDEEDEHMTPRSDTL